jgi:hypothetical protein
MREIKFRAWDVNRIGAFNSILYQDDMELWEFLLELHKHETEYGCKFKLIQFTGLKDKNSVEIYEKDIVENDDGFRFSVDWTEIGYNDGGVGYPIRLDECKSITVIGNIYENPELLDN